MPQPIGRWGTCLLAIAVTAGCQSGLSDSVMPRFNKTRLLADRLPPARTDARDTTAAALAAPPEEPFQFVNGTVRLVAQQQPDPPSVSNSTELLPSGRNTEDQKPPLQPGVGTIPLPPPAIPPLPEGMKAWDQAQGAVEDRPSASLEELETLACVNNPTLAEARAVVEGTFGQAVQAGLWPNPRVFYLGDQIFQKRMGGPPNTPGEFQGMAVQQEFVTAHKRKLSRAKFLEQTAAAEWQAVTQEYQVLNDVRIHYFRTLEQQELVRIQYELLKNMEDRLVTLREMYNLGQATRDELHLANADLQDTRLTLLALQNSYLQSWETLTALVGVDMPPRPLSGNLEEGLEPIEWEAALDRLLAESPEIQRTRAGLRADVIQLKREKVDYIPNVFVRGGTGYNFTSQEPVAQAQVFFDVPVIDWNQGNVRTARAQVDRQTAEVRRVELDLRRRLATVYGTYITALQHVQQYRETVLPEARKAYEVMLDAYKADRVRWTQVLAVEQVYFARRAAYIVNVTTWREAEVLIVGYVLAGGLTPASGATPIPAVGVGGGVASGSTGLIGNLPGMMGAQGNRGGTLGAGQGMGRTNPR